MSREVAVNTLADHWNRRGLGGDDGLVSREDLADLAADEGAPKDLRAAAEYFLYTEGAFDQLDKAAGSGPLGFAWSDNRVSASDLAHEVRGTAFSDDEQATLGFAYRFWNDLSGGAEMLDRDRLEKVANDAGVDPLIRNTAKALLDDPSLFEFRMDTADNGGDPDGRVSKEDAASAVALAAQQDAAEATAGDPAAKAALDRLVASEDFVELSGDTRTALLSQAKNYPNATSIGNLERLAGRDWFRSADLPDQQRSAKMIAYDSQDKSGNIDIKRNTLEHVLNDDDLVVRWESIPKNGTAEAKTWFWGDNTITLNEDSVSAGNEPLSKADLLGKGSEADVAQDTLVHEVNHVVNGDRGSDVYVHFKGEFRSWYVEEWAKNGRRPSPQDCFQYAKEMVTGDGYADIKDAFKAEGSQASKDMVGFLARLSGQDPNQTPDQILDNTDGKPLSTTEEAPLPEKADPNGPDPNYDNS